MKLNLLMADSLPLLAQLLYQFAADLRLDCYQHHYWKDFPILCPFNSSLVSLCFVNLFGKTVIP